MLTLPVFPPLDVPDEKLKEPLDPEVPAFTVLMTTAPLVEADPDPLSIVTAPPVAAELSPAFMVSSPPEPDVPAPTLIETDPPRPPVAEPL